VSAPSATAPAAPPALLLTRRHHIDLLRTSSAACLG